MPIYEYQCQECEENFEILQLSCEEQAAVGCPQCGSEQTEKLISAFSTSAAETGASGCATSGQFR